MEDQAKPDSSPQQTGAPDECALGFVEAKTVSYIPEEGSVANHSKPEAQSSRLGIPNYELLEEVGRGGMGVIYKARHRALKRIVALKMILSGGHADEHDRLRFRAEAEAVARLQHPNIVQVHEVGEHDGLPYAALEFVDGGSLAQKLKKHPLSPRESAKLVETIARAMQLAHSRNIIHRDLKPANILLDAAGSPKVSDFGLARQLDDISHTQTGSVLGTPSYMSPEQVTGDTKHVGPAADVYSLGAILYECLCGHPPFQGGSVVATLDMVRDQQPVAPRLLRTGIPIDLETICLKCLRKEPEKRYASAEALADDLLRWQRGEPIAARPVSLPERMRKWAARRPAIASLIVTLILFLAALLGMGIWSYSTISQALANESAQKLKSQRMSAGLAFDRGLQQCQEGNVAEGLIWMAESLAVNPDQDRHFADVVRQNLAAWQAPLTIQRNIFSHNHPVGCVAGTPDGNTIVTAEEGDVHRWEAATGNEMGKAMTQPGVVASLAISPDGRFIATGSYDKTVRIWDVATGELIGAPIPQPDIVNDVEFSRDGRLLVVATGFRDHSVPSSVGVWEVFSGKPTTPPLQHPATVRGAVFTADGRHVITGAYDGLVRYWNASTGQLDGEPIQVGREVTDIAISRTGSFLAVTCNSGEAFVYLVSDRRLASQPMRHSSYSGCIAFHPDESLLATGGNDGLACVWEWLSGQQISSPLVHQNYVVSVDFTPDGRRLVTGSHDRQARIWDLPLYCRKGIPILQTDRALSLDFLDPALVSARPTTRVTGARGRPIPHWVWEYLSASFSPDGRYVVTGSIDGHGRIWEVVSGRLIGKPLRHDNWVRAVAFAPDNKRVLTGSHDLSARLWDIETGNPLTPALRHSAGIVAVAISPDGKKGLTGSSDRTARLWNLDTGEPIGPPMKHAGDVFAVTFSDDSQWALTGAANGSEGESRLWDAVTATPIGPPARHERGVASVRFDDDGRSFLTLSEEGAARRWPLPRPIAGDPGLIRLWVQVVTGREQDAGKSVVPLEPAKWRECRSALMSSDLASTLVETPDEVLVWHDAMAGANEISRHADAAHWHLLRLMQARPNDWSLHARRAGAFHRYEHDDEARKELGLAREKGGLAAACGWCSERAENLDRLHQHEAALWFRQWIASADPQSPQAHDDLGHCVARLGRFGEACDHFRKAIELEPTWIEFQRDLAIAFLALDDLKGFRKVCQGMLELVKDTADRDVAQLVALACVLDANTVTEWDQVVRLATRAAEGYEGDYRLHAAALYRAGRIEEALQRPWSGPTPYAHVVWEWFFQGLLRLRAGRHDAARSIFEQKFNMTDFMDQAMPRDPKSKVWSDWIYYVECHALRKEAEGLLRDIQPLPKQP